MTDATIERPALLSHLSQRMRAESVALAERWLERLRDIPAVEPLDTAALDGVLDRLPEVVREIAGYLDASPGTRLETNATLLGQAAELGRLRHLQRASVHQLLHEYRLLATVLEDFVESEIVTLSGADPRSTAQAMRRVGESVRILQQHTVDAFVANYTQTIERQTTQLRQFGRLVSHEIRQPLAVLHVITKALPVKAGDDDSAKMMDIFDRSVLRLAEVTGKLERLARITQATDLSPRERTVDLTEVAHTAAAQLRDAAIQGGVQIHVHPNLPVLRVDPARVELIFVNLISNGIKFADPNKPTRYVEVYPGGGTDPSVIVRDNGLGMSRPHLQTVFREFVRAHSQRDDEVRAWGLGLGLSIVRECMDHANGSVRVDSVEGRGTTFKLTWPR